MTEHGIVFLHGIFRTHRSMAGITRYFHKQGYKTLNIGYPSTKHTLLDIAHSIHPRIDDFAGSLSGNLHFVGYSMGGLVIRSYLHLYPAIKPARVVMMGTPNQGSEVADFVKDWRLYRKLYGPAGQQLVTNPSSLGDTVNYELGIIAGNLSITPTGSYIIGKPSDGTVSVESTKLDGMKAHITVPVPHTLFPHSRKTWFLAKTFLENGHFGNN